MPDADAAKSVMKLIYKRDTCMSTLRDILPTTGLEPSQKLLLNDNESTPLFECMNCKSMEDPFKMLICDYCEGAFHLSCCKPRAKKIPEEKWCCQVCSRKKPKRWCKKLCHKYELPKPIQDTTNNYGRRGTTEATRPASLYHPPWRN
jgi:hypothetical protein